MYHLNVGMTLMLGMYQIDLMRWRVTQLMSKTVSSHSAVSPSPTNFLQTMRANSRLSHPFFPDTWSLSTSMAPSSAPRLIHPLSRIEQVGLFRFTHQERKSLAILTGGSQVKFESNLALARAWTITIHPVKHRG